MAFTRAYMLATSTDVCGHCGVDLLWSEDEEVFVDQANEIDCPKAPREVSAAGAKYGDVAGAHFPS